MTLTRWQPLREMMALRDRIDHLFEQSHFPPLPGFDNMLQIALAERENEFVASAPIPGFKPEQIDISIQGDSLTVRGSMEEESQKEEENYHLREWRTESFQRTVRLPMNVVADEAKAKCQDGILTIHLPKAEPNRVKKVAIQQ